jgi:hypothetical protein
MTVIGRRSALAGDDAGAGLVGWAAGFSGPESGDRLEETLAVSQRHADLFEVGFDQVAENARVDLMLAEHGFVLSEVDRVQPLGDVHRRSRTRFDSDDGPRETVSPGRELGRPLWGRLDALPRRRRLTAICAIRPESTFTGHSEACCACARTFANGYAELRDQDKGPSRSAVD